MKSIVAPGSPPIYRLQVLLQFGLIMACKCFSKLTQSPPLNLHYHHFLVPPQTHSITASKRIFGFNQSWLHGTSPNSLHYGLQVYHQKCSVTASSCTFIFTRSQCWSALPTLSITTSNCISESTQSQCQSVSPNLLINSLQQNLSVHSVSPTKCISKFARSQPASASLHLLDCHLLAHLELLSCTACSSPDMPCIDLVAL